MTPEPLDLDAIRARRGIRLPDAPTASEDLAALLAHIDALTAKLDAVRALHKRVGVGCLTGDCAIEDCDHEEIDECKTVEVDICAACNELAESVDPYFGIMARFTALRPL